MRRGWWGGVLLLAVVPATVSGQDLGATVAAIEDGVVLFSFPTRDDVQFCDQGIRIGEDHQVMWRSNGRDRYPENCRYGPAEVEVEVRDGMPRDVEVMTDGKRRARDPVVIGEVPAAEALAFFEGIVRGNGSDRAAREAVFPMILVDVDDAWRPLLAVARDRQVPRGARKNALFWLGQEAAEAATDGLADVARDVDEEQDVRDAAVFALSQRSAEESIPLLMELARDADQAKTRKSAMFWLAQSEDDRVVAFFEDILLGRIRR